jgi:hypothetical protein
MNHLQGKKKVGLKIISNLNFKAALKSGFCLLMKELFKGLPLVTLIIIYLYISGGLYLIGFWTTFKIDISNFVSLADIPKNFIYPFVLSQTVILIFAIAQIVITKLIIELKIINFNFLFRQRKVSDDKLYMGIDAFLLLVLWIFFLLLWQMPRNIYYWTITGILIAIIACYKLANTKIAIELIGDLYRRVYLLLFLIGVPIFSFLAGKDESLNIYYNNSSKLIKIISPIVNQTNKDSISRKLLGFLGDKLIISTLDNEKIEVLNQSAFERVELTTKEEEK